MTLHPAVEERAQGAGPARRRDGDLGLRITPDLEATLKNLPRSARRLPHEGRARAGGLRGEGPAQSGPQLLAEEAGSRPRGTSDRAVVDRIADVDYTIVNSVSEALLLENSLIKRYKPRYNVRLKDESYPSEITLADDFRA